MSDSPMGPTPPKEVVPEQESLDLTTDQPASGDGEDQAIKQKPYDSRPTEDTARKYIAYALIALLFIICISTIIGVMAGWLNKDEATALLQLILSPIVALVSAATGFYYGTKSNTGGNQ